MNNKERRYGEINTYRTCLNQESQEETYLNSSSERLTKHGQKSIVNGQQLLKTKNHEVMKRHNHLRP